MQNRKIYLLAAAQTFSPQRTAEKPKPYNIFIERAAENLM
jgi:hypothetical protein